MNLLEQATQPTEPAYSLITLTQGLFAKVDPQDFYWLNQWKWCVQLNRKNMAFYAVRNEYVPGDRKHPKRLIMARVIMDAPKGILVDHLDLDTLNNQRYNLRLATIY